NGQALFKAVAQQPVQETFTLSLRRRPDREARDPTPAAAGRDRPAALAAAGGSLDWPIGRFPWAQRRRRTRCEGPVAWLDTPTGHRCHLHPLSTLPRYG